MSEVMNKKNKNKDKNNIKLEIPKNLIVKKGIENPIIKKDDEKLSIVKKFAPENKSVDKTDDLKNMFIDEKEFLEYVDQSIKENFKNSLKSKGKQMEEVFKTLDHIMPEFYQTCMIFGFNALGEKTIYMYAPSEKDKDALFHHVKTTVFNLGG